MIYGKFWRREKIGNRVIVSPKVGVSPVGISKELVAALKEALTQCSSDSIPEFYTIKGLFKSGCLLYYDFDMGDEDKAITKFNSDLNFTPEKSELDVRGSVAHNREKTIKGHMMLTTPTSSEITGILQRNLCMSTETVISIPELRMESVHSPERNRNRYNSKINMFCLYPN